VCERQVPSRGLDQDADSSISGENLITFFALYNYAFIKYDLSQYELHIPNIYTIIYPHFNIILREFTIREFIGYFVTRTEHGGRRSHSA